MRSIAAVSIIASLLTFACGSGQDAAGKPDAKTSDDAKVAVPEIAPPPVPVEPEPAVPVEPPAEDDFGDEFCETIIPCYQKLEFAGNFMADVTVDIEPDGSVSAVSFTGEAPKPVQTCITTAIKNTKLAVYNGKPGRTRCTQGGQLMGGTQMVTSDRNYEVREVGEAKAKAEAEANAKTEPEKAGKPGKAGKAKTG
jgi:hypothetical protein